MGFPNLEALDWACPYSPVTIALDCTGGLFLNQLLGCVNLDGSRCLSFPSTLWLSCGLRLQALWDTVHMHIDSTALARVSRHWNKLAHLGLYLDTYRRVVWFSKGCTCALFLTSGGCTPESQLIIKILTREFGALFIAPMSEHPRVHIQHPWVCNNNSGHSNW